MFNWFRQTSKSTARRAPITTRHLKQHVEYRPLSKADAESMLPGASQLNAYAQQVVAKLPAHVRPALCCLQHPWMLERLLEHWEKPANFRRELNDLLIDTRGNRRGFSFEALAELTVLGEYYNTYVSPLPEGWASIDPR